MSRRTDMVPVLFKGGPLHRQVHVWAKADAEGATVVRMDHDGGSGFYIRSRRWRSLLSTHRALIYAWKAETYPSEAPRPSAAAAVRGADRGRSGKTGARTLDESESRPQAS